MKRHRSAKHTQILNEKNTAFERHHELINFTQSVLDLEAEISDTSIIPSSMIVDNDSGLQANDLPDMYGDTEHSDANSTINQILDDSLPLYRSVTEQETLVREAEDKWSIDQKHCRKAAPLSPDSNSIGKIQLSRVYFSQKKSDESFSEPRNHIDDYILTERGLDEHLPLLPAKRRKVAFNDIVSKQYYTNNPTRRTSDKTKSSLKGLFQKSAKLSKNSNISANHYLYFLPKRRQLVNRSNKTKYDRTQISVNRISDVHRGQVEERTNSLTNARFLQTHLTSDDDADDDDDDEDYEDDDNDVDEAEDGERDVEPQMQVVLDNNGRVRVTNVFPSNTSSKSKGMIMTTHNRSSSDGTVGTHADNSYTNANFYRDSEPTCYQTDHNGLLSKERTLGFAERKDEGYQKSAFKAYTPHNATQMHNDSNRKHPRRLADLNSYSPQKNSENIFMERKGLNYSLPGDSYLKDPSAIRSHNNYLPKLIDTNDYDKINTEHCIKYNQFEHKNRQYYEVEGFNGVHGVSLKQHVRQAYMKSNLPASHPEASQCAQNMLYIVPEDAQFPDSVEYYRARYANPGEMNQNKTHHESDHAITRNTLLAKQHIDNDGTAYSSQYMYITPEGCEVRKSGSMADVEFAKSDETAKNAYIARHLVDARGKPFIAVYPTYDKDKGANSQSVKEIERDNRAPKTAHVSRIPTPDNRALCHVYKPAGSNIITTNESHANLQHKLQRPLSSSQHIQISTTPRIPSRHFVSSTKSELHPRNVAESKSLPNSNGRLLSGGQRSSITQNEKRIQVETIDNADQSLYQNLDNQTVVNDIVGEKYNDNNGDDGGNAVEFRYKYNQLNNVATANTKQPKLLNHNKNASFLNNDVDDEHPRYKSVDYQTNSTLNTASNRHRNTDNKKHVTAGVQNRIVKTDSCYQQNGSANIHNVEHLTNKYALSTVNNEDNNDEPQVYRHPHLKNASVTKSYKSADQQGQRYNYAAPTTALSGLSGQNQQLCKHNNQISTPSSSTNSNKVNAEQKDDSRNNCKSINTDTNKTNSDKDEHHYNCKLATTEEDTKSKDTLSTSTPSKDSDYKEEYKYKCEWPACSKSFRHYSFLVLHRRIHSGERPYICSWEGCNKQFRRSDDYQRHYRVHTGVRPFPCEVCGKSFKRSDHRLFHYRAIHNLHK